MKFFSWCGAHPKEELSKRDQKMKDALSPNEFKKYMRNKSKERAKHSVSNKIREDNNSRNEYIEKCRKSYSVIQSSMSFAYQNAHKATVSGRMVLLWIADEKLKIIEAYPPTIQLENRYVEKQPIPKWISRTISLSEIEYFSVEGEVYTETKIFGGETKPVDLVDVAIAGAVAGATGAIIASRPKSEPIRSKTIRHDERKTILVYSKGKLEFAPEDYDVLMRLIPDKEFSVVQQKRALQKAGQAEMQAEKKDDVVNSLRKLKMMLEEGLISQDEYNSKKTEILGRM